MKARRLAVGGCVALAVLAVAAPSASAARDRTPPSTPTNVRVTGATEDSLTVTWTRSTDNSGRIQSYIVYPDYWNGSGVYHPGSSTTKVLTGLVPNFTVSVRVQAIDAAGNRSAMSAPGTGTTERDVIPPTTPGNLRVTGTTPSSVSLAWDRSSDRWWPLSYEVLMDGEVVGGRTFGDENIRLRHLAPGSTHTFVVRARDTSGNLSQNSNAVTVTLPASSDRTPPSAPRNLTATTPADDFCGTNVLRWEPASDNVDSGSQIEYEIYLNGSFFTLTQPGATSAFPYTNAGTNTWTVVAVDRSGNSSAPSNPATVTVRVDVDQC
jgi:chitodextrinase